MAVLKKRLASFRYAFRGLVHLFQSQVNARIHLGAALLAVCLGVCLHISRMEWLLVVICITMVVALEALNTAIEHLTDLVSPEYHPLAGKTKDVAAAGVLVAAMGALVVGGMIFLPKMATFF